LKRLAAIIKLETISSVAMHHVEGAHQQYYHRSRAHTIGNSNTAGKKKQKKHHVHKKYGSLP